MKKKKKLIWEKKIVIMAQIGCYLPASSCSMACFDRIFVRAGASDNISFVFVFILFLFYFYFVFILFLFLFCKMFFYSSGGTEHIHGRVTGNRKHSWLCNKRFFDCTWWTWSWYKHLGWYHFLLLFHFEFFFFIVFNFLLFFDFSFWNISFQKKKVTQLHTLLFNSSVHTSLLVSCFQLITIHLLKSSKMIRYRFSLSSSPFSLSFPFSILFASLSLSLFSLLFILFVFSRSESGFFIWHVLLTKIFLSCTLFPLD